MEIGKGLAQTQEPKGRQGQIPEEWVVLFILHRVGIWGEQLSLSPEHSPHLLMCRVSIPNLFPILYFPAGARRRSMGIPFLYLVEKKGNVQLGRNPINHKTQFPLFQISLFNPEQPGSSTQTLHAQPWLSFPGRELPDVSSLCSQDVWEVQILSALWIIQRGRSGRTQDRQSCCPRVISNANVCTLKPSRGGRVNHFKLTEVHFANWFFLRWSSTFWKFMVCAALRPRPEHSWGCLKYRGSQWQVCCVLQTVEPAADSCWNSHGSQAWLGWV